ncbi:hypothetical protein FOA52_015952 [Chlamydomonas sp. UWO 241]|nr:hypothetical protein FOA52_015952 [Chlamydomonas sp. UWO 241]
MAHALHRRQLSVTHSSTACWAHPAERAPRPRPAPCPVHSRVPTPGSAIHARPDVAVRAIDAVRVTAPAAAPAATPASPASRPLTVALVGFGNFGQFLAGRFLRNNHKVIAWNRKETFDYPGRAKEMGVEFYESLDGLCEAHPDVVILVTSILSTKPVLESVPWMRLKMSTLFVDVLSVKVFPKQLLTSKLPDHFDILCTHPMFGVNSGSGSWAGLNFQYEKVRVGSDPERVDRAERFLKIFADEGCRMVEMTCEEHDEAAASTQFVTHTVGRMLGTMRLQSTPINTKGFEALLTLTNQTNTDSFDLYYGLFLYNQNATEELERIEKASASSNVPEPSFYGSGFLNGFVFTIWGSLLYNQIVTEELERIEKGLESVKDRLFSRLHDIARREMFPKAMLEKMLSKESATVLKLFFRGLARLNQLTFASTTSVEVDAEPMYEDHPEILLPLYTSCLQIWRDKALAAGGEPPRAVGANETISIDTAHNVTLPANTAKGLNLMREAFAFVDLDNSGQLSPGELSSRVLKLSDTRMSPEDIEKMINLADFDGDGQISIRELFFFCAYEFFCCGAFIVGEIDGRSLQGAIEYLELPSSFATTADLRMMVKYASGGAGEEGKSLHSIKAFALVFEDLGTLVAEGEDAQQRRVAA